MNIYNGGNRYCFEGTVTVLHKYLILQEELVDSFYNIELNIIVDSLRQNVHQCYLRVRLLVYQEHNFS